jgi:two-component system chemotaxis response regulator CheY
MTTNLQYLRVLIVEDQTSTRTMLRDMVRSLGIETVLTAHDGREALGVIEAEDDLINLIICDWVMPEMSGLELLTEVRRRYPHMPFLMVTGKADREAVKTAIDGGVSGYIAKPFSRAQIEIKLRILGRRVLLNANAAE